MNSLTQLPIWKILQAHHHEIMPLHMRDLFEADPTRFEKFSLSAAGLMLDFSKNRITEHTIALLVQLAEACHLPKKITALFNGELLNSTEQRAALHTAIRTTNDSLLINNRNILPEIKNIEKKLFAIANVLLQQQWRGFSNQPITDIVNIGIGGSELGSAMVTTALRSYTLKKLRCHYVSNIDGTHIEETLKNLNPATTLFIISSKNFSTQETIYNAKTARAWLMDAANNVDLIQKQFIAITCKPKRAREFGIPDENILPIWDWLGGRFSLWSAVGLPVILNIGMDNFKELLAGANAMDQHFQHAPLIKNMPVVLALLNIWYTNFFGAHSQAILPYDQNLQLLPNYLQQLHMESLGKQTRHHGTPVDYITGGTVWGGVGSNGQHAFHQLLHQGTQFIPADFIIALQHQHQLEHHHDALFANCLSQSQALMSGKNYQEIVNELIANGATENDAKKLAPHKVLPGNRPSNTIVLQKLTPFSLGALIALYEHKVFTQSIIWDINCFDQWGVELGKQIANQILQDIQHQKISEKQDASTQGLMKHYLAKRE